MKEKIFEKGIVRRLFSVVLALAMVVSLSTLNSMVVHADSTHTEHGTALTAAGGTLTTGNYHLDSDVTLTSNIEISGDVNLCLNGHVLKGASGNSVINVGTGATLNIYDCSTDAHHKFSVNSDTSCWTWNDGAGDGISLNDITSVPASGVIIVDGGCITGGTGKLYYDAVYAGGGINVDGGTVVLHAGNIVGNTSTLISGQNGFGYGGGGVNVINGGTFTMNGGTIAGNYTSRDGGGVNVAGASSIFNLHSGKIVANYATASGMSGGGFFLNHSSKLNMDGGQIIYNKTNGSSGAVFVHNSSRFTMTGGEIKNNVGHSNGAVYLHKGTSLIMTGGVITGNTAETNAGICVRNDDSNSITLGGTAVIQGNKAGSAESNVVLLSNTKYINLSTENSPASGMQIGVTMQTPGVFTTNTADGYLSYFSSDDSTNKVVYDTDKKLKLVKQYNVTIVASITNGTVTTDATDSKAPAGDTITVTTTPSSGYTLNRLIYNDGTEHDITSAKSFTMPEADVTITAEFVPDTRPASSVTTAPTAKSLTYNGADQALVTEGTALGGTMNYAIGDSSTAAPTIGWSTSVPTGKNAGTYYVWYKCVGDSEHSDSEPVCVTVTLAKANHTVTAPTARNPVYNGNEQVLISAGSCTTGTIKYSLDGTDYYDSIDSIKKKEIGSYTVYYRVEDEGNYETYGHKSITAKIVKKSDPTPTPTPTPKPDPQPNPQPTITVTSSVQYAETGNPIKNYVANNPTGSNIPLPFITTDSSKAGWKTIDEALDAHKANFKKKAVGTLSITMNGSTTVDTKLITDAHEKKIPLSFALDDEVAIGIPVANTVLSDQAKEGMATYFKVSSMTTAEAVGVKKAHAGLLPSDIVAIGGDANTPVVLTLCSNDKLSTKKSQLMTITFNAKKAGFKKGDRVYLYCGTSQIGIAMYKTGKVDKNGFVTFSVPMVSNYWTIGSKNMKNKLL